MRLIGKSDSATRTAEQTTIARLWTGIAANGTGTATNFMSVWNTIVRDVARQRRLSLVETARVFALVNVSVHDALQTTQTSKFVYGMWRPVTAIRQADTDLNPGTDPDATWLPLLTTPPYPSYAGNMATIGASAARALQLAFGTNDIPVRATWRQSNGQPDVTHDFAGFWQVAEEQADSRIYGGIHYRFDSLAGQQIGKRGGVRLRQLHDVAQPLGRLTAARRREARTDQPVEESQPCRRTVEAVRLPPMS